MLYVERSSSAIDSPSASMSKISLASGELGISFSLLSARSVRRRRRRWCVVIVGEGGATNPSDWRRANISRAMTVVSFPGVDRSRVKLAVLVEFFSPPVRRLRDLRVIVSPLRRFSINLSRALSSSSGADVSSSFCRLAFVASIANFRRSKACFSSADVWFSCLHFWENC